MPKLEPKSIQKELDQGLIRPFYWIYGQEVLKARELFKRIQKSVLGQEPATPSLGLSWNEESFDGSEVDGMTVRDAAWSFSLGGGVKLVTVRDAHHLKNPESLIELCGPPQKRADLMSVCVCFSKDLDARKKFSKNLIEKAAVVLCEEVSESEREAWILYLAKRKSIEINASQVLKLSTLDPWSLDIIQQELEKYSLSGFESDAFLKESGNGGGADAFIEKFFSRKLEPSLSQLSYFAGHVDEALPLLGLLGWNGKQLASYLADEVNGTQYFKPNPYLVNRLKHWAKCWNLDEVIDLQSELFFLDKSFKQTPALPLGLWSALVQRFCQ